MSNVAIKSGTQLPPSTAPNIQMGAFIINPSDNKTYYATWQQIADMLGVNLATSGIQGIAITTTVPIAVGFARYMVNTSGTFTNFKDAGNAALVVSAGDLSSGIVEFWGKNNVWEKHITPVAFSDYLNVNTASLFNLVPNANRGLELIATRNVLTADNIPVFYLNVTTPSFVIQKDLQGFPVSLKVTTKIGDRAIIASGIIDLTGAVVAGSSLKLNAGVFIKVPSGFDGVIALRIQKPDLSVNLGGGNQEFIQLDNGWRYYRFNVGLAITFSGGQCVFWLELDNRTGTQNNDFIVAAPAIVKTDGKLAPGIYVGIDNPKFQEAKLYETMPNRIYDAEFVNQTAGVEPSGKWTISFGGATAFKAPATMQYVDTPIGTTAIEISHSKRSSDNFTSDLQIIQKITIPLKYQKKTVWAAGFFMKRTSASISVRDLSATYYSDDAGTVTLTTNTKVFAIENETLGDWVFVKAENIVLPAGAKSMTLTIGRTGFTGAELDTVRKIWITGLSVRFDAGTINYPSYNFDEKVQSLIPDLSLYTQYTDFYELNNNVFFDPLMVKQIVGGGGVSLPYTMETGNPANVFAAPTDIVLVDSPVGNRAVQISVQRRSSDNKYSDNQLKQLVQIPRNLQGKTLSSFGYWMKRENIAKTVIMHLVQFYSDAAGTVQVGSNINANSTITGETVNQWTFVKAENLTVPAGAVSARFTPRIMWNSTDTTTLDTPYKVWITGLTAGLLNGVMKGFTRSRFDSVFNVLFEKLIGKKWCSYGDSITAANEYQKPVLSRYGLTHALRGIGGTAVHEIGTIAWVDANGLYLDRPPATQPPGSFQINSSMSHQDRINTIPLDTQIITVMGGTNDVGVTIGTISDTGTTTFYGAYNTMLQRIYTRIPNAEILLCTPIHRNDDDATNIEQIRVAIRALAVKYKLRLIDMANSGINALNYTVWLADGIHPKVPEGYERLSREFLNVFPDIYG